MAARTPFQAFTGAGSRQRSAPTGGSAKGTPLKTAPPFSSAAPRTLSARYRDDRTGTGSCYRQHGGNGEECNRSQMQEFARRGPVIGSPNDLANTRRIAPQLGLWCAPGGSSRLNATSITWASERDAEWQQLAHFVRYCAASKCRLWGQERKRPERHQTNARDPERSSAGLSCCSSEGGFSPYQSIRLSGYHTAP